MSALKRLASQTAIYGMSSIVGRFLNYLLVPLYTYRYSTGEYGVVSELYAYAGFFAVILVFGMETGYFRFRQQVGANARKVYGTALNCVLIANLVFVGLFFAYSDELARLLRYEQHPEYLRWFALFLAFDSLSAIPFAQLRAENRAFQFAGIKIAEILVTIALNVFFIVYLRDLHASDPDAPLARLYDPAMGVGYIFIANLLGSGFKLLLLLPRLTGIAAGIDRRLLRRMLSYSLPMVVIGLAGIVDEMLGRAILKFTLPYDLETNLQQLGIYGACYKLSVLMSLFIQAFRYAGEPFFFSYADKRDAKQVYAQVLRYFVIFCVFVFLLVMLYLDLFQYFIGAEFRAGLTVVPILLMASLFLGIYVNLSIWYKLTDRTGLGAGVALFGAVLTVALNFLWIPRLGYVGSALATLSCYVSMTVLSYALGRRYYPVDYDVGAILGYIFFGVFLYFANCELIILTGWHSLLSGSLVMAFFLLVAAAMEFRRLRRLRRKAATAQP
jgi:O-antigen/teichoic acid export membrane protein